LVLDDHQGLARLVALQCGHERFSISELLPHWCGHKTSLMVQRRIRARLAPGGSGYEG
jgi:hypothetical protein